VDNTRPSEEDAHREYLEKRSVKSTVDGRLQVPLEDDGGIAQDIEGWSTVVCGVC